jgi:5-methylthioadenosine/S-adenosylhomocysteine deaminase
VLIIVAKRKAGSTSFVITNALLVTQDAKRSVVRGDIKVDGNRIAYVGTNAPRSGAEVIDGSAYAIVPGFVNLHTHVAMAPLRGMADDMGLTQFLETLFKIDSKRTAADVEAGALTGVAEMLLSGTTTFLDMYYAEDSVAKATKHLGARGFLGWAVLDKEITTQKGIPLKNAEKFVRQWRGDALITPLVAPQGVYACSEDTWMGAKDIANKYNTYCHFHLSETEREVKDHIKKTGKRPAEWLDSIGFLGPRMVAAHAVWLNSGEIKKLGAHHIGIAHCASSNMKLASGNVCPILELEFSGARIGIGTDSVASNNSLSMLREMHVASLLQKNHRRNAALVTAQQVLDFATIGGARALGMEKELGSLEKGKLADFSLFRLNHYSMQPASLDKIVSHIAYSASDEAIEAVYVGGEKVVGQRRIVQK